jgi:hypothetical protein
MTQQNDAMSEKEKKLESEKQPSEEYIQFEAAMRKIVSVGKAEIVQRLPKMFRERVADRRKKRARKAKKRS